MFSLKFPRLPYPNDRLFGFLFLTVLVVPLAFSLLTYESFDTLKFGLFFILVGAAILAVCCKNFSRLQKIRGPKKFYVVLGLFWLWALLVSLLAWDKNYSFFGFYPRFTNGFLFYSLWTAVIVLLGLLSREQIKFLLKMLFFVSGLCALWGILQSLGVGFYLGLQTELFSRGAPSFLGNPNFSAMFVASLMPLGLAFDAQAESFKKKIYYALFLFVQLCSLITFASRGALFGLVVGFFAFFILAFWYLRQQNRKIITVTLVALVVGLGLGLTFFNIVRPNSVSTTVNLSDVNISNRLGVWQLAVKSTLKRPIFGVGLGSFQLMFEHDRTVPIVSAGFFDDAHNLPLELSVTGGIPLALLFFALIGYGLAGLFKQLRLQIDLENIAIIVAIVAWIVAGLFTPVVIPCYLALAILVSSCFSQDGEFLKRPLIESKLLQKIFIGLGGALVIYGCLFLTAEVLFFSGIKAYGAQNFDRAYKEIRVATWLNPTNRFYYVYLAGSAIRQGQPLKNVSGLMALTDRYNPRRANSYVQDANLYYLLLYRTQNPVYRDYILRNMQTAIKMDPFLSNNYMLLAEYQIVFGDINSALFNIQKGLSLSPDNFQYEMLLAKLYQIQNNKAAFVQALKRGQQIQPDNINLIWILRGAEKVPNIQVLPLQIHLDLGDLQN